MCDCLTSSGKKRTIITVCNSSIRFKGGSWWIWKKDVKFKGMVLNFKDCDGFYSDLYDECEYNSLLDALSKEIKNDIESALDTGVPLKF